MINDSVLFPSRKAATGCEDRRAGDRVPFPSEVVLIWHHDTAQSIRYRVLDISDNSQGGGMRIRSSMPLLEGTTGMALRLLPQGVQLDRPVMVRWSRQIDEGGYDVGLRFF